MPLSNEDSLRLNVLCAQAVKVIRINESSMLLNALTERGEARIELNPNARHETYLREVREFLSEKFLGMPGGFPRHLERWTRMGVSNFSVDKMLLLGQREAIIALSCSNEINPEQAAYAWWAVQSAEVARNLLKSSAVRESDLGAELARFLLEFLPFEERTMDIVESVRLCIQDNLLSETDRAELWSRAKRKNPYFVGFLLAGPQAIPLDETPHPEHASSRSRLSGELKQHNPYAQYFIHFLSADGRKWLKSLAMALKKPGDPNVVIALFICIEHYIDLSTGPSRGVLEIESALEEAQRLCSTDNGAPHLQAMSKLLDAPQILQLKAMLVLAQLGENTLNRYFGGRDATGTVMRNHLKPLTNQLTTTINTLLQ